MRVHGSRTAGVGGTAGVTASIKIQRHHLVSAGSWSTKRVANAATHVEFDFSLFLCCWLAGGI